MKSLFAVAAFFRNLAFLLVPESSHRADSDLLAKAFAEAMARFPNDPVVQEARALSALAMRDVLGQRRYDC